MGTKNFSNANDLITFSRSSAGTALRKVAYGPELVTNGTFDTDLSGWTDVSNGTALVEWVSGVASFDDSQGGNSVGKPKLEQSITGSGTFLVSFDTEADSSFTVQNGEGLSVVTNDGKTSRSLVVTATSSPWTLSFQLENSAVARTADNVSVKEVLFDDASGDLTLFNHPAGIPRIEYDADGNVLGLLVEESRTNLLTYSEDFSVGATTREDAGEFQGMSRKLFTKPTTSAVAYSHTFTASVGDYTLTLVMERGTNRYTSFGLIAGGWLGLARIDWDSMIIQTAAGTLQSSSVEILGTGPSGNPVARLTATINVPSAGTVQFKNYLFNSTTTVENLTVYFYHQQVEAGSFPTSYIPTSGATATRSADVASIPVADFGYNQSEGTVVVEASTASTAQTNHTDLRIKDGSSLPLVSSGSRVGGSSEGTYSLYSPNTTILVNVSSVVTEGSTYRSAYRLADNDVALSVNGSTVATDTSVTFTSLTAAAIEIGDGYGYLNGHIKSIKYYPRRLTNAQLQELTT